ncbi:unnamed protein product, partial [Polarella glacialis]
GRDSLSSHSNSGSHERAGSSCFHYLQHRPVWASKARASLVGSGFAHVHSSKKQPPLGSVQRFAENPQKKLTRELSTATSAQAVLSVLEQEDMYKLNEFHIGAAFTRLAKHKYTFTSAVRESPVLRKVTARLQQIMDTDDGLDARGCANVFWSIAALQSETPELQELLPKLIENAKFTAPYMNAQGVSNIVWACAKSSLSSSQLRNLLPPMLERLVDRADSLKPQDIANCIWASAKLRTDAPELLEVIPVLLEMAEEKAQDFKAQDLSNVIWSSGILRQQAPELQNILPALVPELPKIMDDMTTQALSNAAWGLALCEYKDVEFMQDAASRLAERASSMGKNNLLLDLPQLVCALAKLGMHNSALLEATSTHLSTVLKKSVDWTLCSLVWSYGKLDPNRHFAEFQDSLAKEVKRRRLSAEEVESSQLGPQDWAGANRSRTDHR